MQIFNIKGGVESGLEGACVAIGNFDGVHKGHAAIIKQLKDKAESLKKPVGILTFNPNPMEYFSGEENYQLTKFEDKARILDEMELDFVAYAEFNEELSKISAEDFVKDILVKKLKVSHVFTGEDFKFGYKAKGDSTLLEKMAKEYGFGYTPVAKIKDENGKRYSSSEARKLIGEGDVIGAEKILGRKFAISGIVQHGKKQAGSVLGYPTANIKLDGYVLPKFGVYECVVKFNSQSLKAIANMGIKPTYGDNKPLLEVHILNFDGDLYNKNILVELVSFIREEIKFNSVDELKKQIEKDVKKIS